MKNLGFTPHEFSKEKILEEMDEEEQRYKLITSFSKAEKQKYLELLERLKAVHRKNSKASNEEKGKALEELVSFLFKSTSVFEIFRNIRTSSNEIDQLITLNAKGRYYRQKGYIDIKEDCILSECKNYQSTIGVTWVGKFASLMDYTNSKIGLLFSYHGLSGKGWDEAVGLTKKLYLGRCENRKIYILDFNKNDFAKIAEGTTLLELIRAKMIALQTDTNFEHLISPHPAQES